VTYNSTNNMLIQMHVPDAYRGRVLSMLYVNRGIVPLGTAVTGAMAEFMGAPYALALMSCCLLAFSGVAIMLRPPQPAAAPSHEVNAEDSRH
jgi:MFS transporter, DHA1 family, staphyloferrin A biosynthesis exporter